MHRTLRTYIIIFADEEGSAKGDTSLFGISSLYGMLEGWKCLALLARAAAITLSSDGIEKILSNQKVPSHLQSRYATLTRRVV